MTNTEPGRANPPSDAYACILPRQSGSIVPSIFRALFSRVRLGGDHVDTLRSLPSDALVVYVMKRRSRFAYLFYHTRYARLGLPCPEVFFDDNFILWQPVSRILKIWRHRLRHLCRHFRLPDAHKEGIPSRHLLNGKAAILSLAEHRVFLKGFTGRQTDPLQTLIQLQEQIPTPIYLVPQILVFEKKPDSTEKKVWRTLFGSPQSPGTLRRLFFLAFRSAPAIAEVSEPVNLKRVLELFQAEKVIPGNRALLLRHILMKQLNQHQQSITGPALKSAEELKQTILTHPELHEFMGKYARRRGLSRNEVRREAVGYLDEISAQYRPRVVAFGTRLVKWLVKQMFDGVSYNVEGLDEVKRCARKGPVIFMPCHRSHFDYFIVPYLLYTHNMPWPHIFAGQNLSFFPMGLVFRSVGAFFVRRTFAGAVFYTKVFSAYIHMLLKEGYNIKVYIEGGRSRTGKLLPPKLGMINILLNAFLNGACDELTFVPIYVGYDRVPEETAYLAESAGESKSKENFLQTLKAGKLLKRRYGKICLRFDHPFSLSSLLKGVGDAKRSGASLDTKTRNALCRAIGYRAVNAIDQRCVVTPQGLVAGALLNGSKRFITRAHVHLQVRTYLYHLCCREVELSGSLIKDHERAVLHILNDFLRRKLIAQHTQEGGTGRRDIIYGVVAGKRAVLEYYKNNCISFFIPAAYTALAILELDALQFPAARILEGYRFLSRLFSIEFPRYADETAPQQIRKAVKAFIDDGILTPHPSLPDTYRITSPGLRKMGFFGRFLVSFMEAYRIVLAHLEQYPRNTHSRELRIKKIQVLGTRMFKGGEVLRKEALSKMYYQNALESYSRDGIRGAEDKDRILDTDARLSHFIELVV